MIFSHAFAGALTTYGLLRFNKGKESEIKDGRDAVKDQSIIYIVGILSSILPDIDLVLVFLYPGLDHRSLLTHSIVPYILVFLMFYFVINFVLKSLSNKKKYFFNLLSLSFLFGVLSHLLFDLMVGGLRLFLPISEIYIGYRLPERLNGESWLEIYFKSGLFLIEVILAFIFIYFVNTKKISNKFGVIIPSMLFIVSILLAVIFNQRV